MNTLPIEIKEIYAALSDVNVSVDILRKNISILSLFLGNELKKEKIPTKRTLIITVLRGGMLMFPSFYNLFGDSTYGFIAASRSNDGIKYTYCALPEKKHYNCIILLDTVSGTGETITKVYEHLIQQGFTFDKKYVCVISMTLAAYHFLKKEKWEIFGASVDEENIRGLVIPDLGIRDAGELVIGENHGNLSSESFPSEDFFSVLEQDSLKKDTRQRLIFEPIIKLVQTIQPRILIDIGCGDGKLTKQLAKHADNILAFDTSEQAIAKAQRESANYNIVYNCRVPGKSEYETADCLICIMVLNVVQNCEDFLTEILKCCKINSVQIWTFLHPAFQYNSSQWQAKSKITYNQKVISYQVEPTYFDHHSFVKMVGNARIEEFHRPISYYLNTFIRHGLIIEQVLEPHLAEKKFVEQYCDQVFPKIITIVTRKAK